jgi:hypothetical protein
MSEIDKAMAKTEKKNSASKIQAVKNNEDDENDEEKESPYKVEIKG